MLVRVHALTVRARAEGATAADTSSSYRRDRRPTDNNKNIRRWKKDVSTWKGGILAQAAGGASTIVVRGDSLTARWVLESKRDGSRANPSIK